MTTQTTILIIYASIFGLVVGSFLNVCIYRIPKKESLVITRSHCMNCGHQLAWYELIPVFSYFIQGGRCRHCKTRLSIQYPMIELLNAIGYVWIFVHQGYGLKSVLYCLATSIWIVVSVIDEKTMEIPIGCNLGLLLLGIAQTISDSTHWYWYLIGAVSVSGFLTLLYWITKGNGIGGGDIKLMATCGLLLGVTNIVIAFLLGCILASVIHLIRIIGFHASRKLAFGPYLCMGAWIAALYGNELLHWYLQMF